MRVSRKLNSTNATWVVARNMPLLVKRDFSIEIRIEDRNAIRIIM